MGTQSVHSLLYGRTVLKLCVASCRVSATRRTIRVAACRCRGSAMVAKEQFPREARFPKCTGKNEFAEKLRNKKILTAEAGLSKVKLRFNRKWNPTVTKRQLPDLDPLLEDSDGDEKEICGLRNGRTMVHAQEPRDRSRSRSPATASRPGPDHPHHFSMHSLLIEIIGHLRASPRPHSDGLWMSHLNSDCWHHSGSGSLKRLI